MAEEEEYNARRRRKQQHACYTGAVTARLGTPAQRFLGSRDNERVTINVRRRGRICLRRVHRTAVYTCAVYWPRHRGCLGGLRVHLPSLSPRARYRVGLHRPVEEGSRQSQKGTERRGGATPLKLLFVVERWDGVHARPVGKVVGDAEKQQQEAHRRDRACSDNPFPNPGAE